MDEKINNILEDLYQIDPSFREHEENLVKIVSELLKERPEPVIDADFISGLRNKLLARAEASGSPVWKMDIWSKFAFGLGGLAVMVLLVVPVLTGYVWNQSGGKISLEFDSKITRLEGNAFGSLADLRLDSRESPNPAPLGLGGDMAASESSVNRGGGGMAVDGRMTMPMTRVNYEYEYEGEDFSIDQDFKTVYKRNTNQEAGAALGQNISNLVNIDLVNLTQFQNVKMNNLNLVEDREFGYQLYFNLHENSVSISPYWERWPQDNNDRRIDISQIPDDQAIVSLADSFLSDYGVDTSRYGEPRVNHDWRRYYELAEDKSTVYIPENMTVVYPMLIEGKEAYDEGGSPTGIYVNVDIRNMKASGLNNYYFYNFQGSDYAVEQDKERVMQFATRGGMYADYRHEDPTRTVTVKLGTPEEKLVRIWKYNPEDKSGGEFFVPALVFPVVDSTDQENFRKTRVVVPIIKEILDEREKNSDQVIGIPEPMPMMRGSGPGAPVDSEDEVRALPLEPSDAPVGSTMEMPARQ